MAEPEKFQPMFPRPLPGDRDCYCTTGTDKVCFAHAQWQRAICELAHIYGIDYGMASDMIDAALREFADA